MRTITSFAFVLLAACGSSNSNAPMIDAPASGDGGTAIDGPPTGPTFKISGSTTIISFTGSAPGGAGITVAAFTKTPEQQVASTTTDMNGNYTLFVPNTGTPLDGFLKATSSGNADTYLYPPAPLTGDFTGASMNIAVAGLLQFIPGTGGGQSGDSIVALEVLDGLATLKGVSGAMVTATPAPPAPGKLTIAYAGANGQPAMGATSTPASGIAFVFGLGLGDATVSATAPSMSFADTKFSVHSNALNTTIILKKP